MLDEILNPQTKTKKRGRPRTSALKLGARGASRTVVRRGINDVVNSVIPSSSLLGVLVKAGLGAVASKTITKAIK